MKKVGDTLEFYIKSKFKSSHSNEVLNQHNNEWIRKLKAKKATPSIGHFEMINRNDQ